MDELVAWLREQIAEIRKSAEEDREYLRSWSPAFDEVGYKVALAQCGAHEAIIDAVQRGLDGHPGPCVNVIGDDPADYTPYDSCALHIEWAKTTLPPYAAQLVASAYQNRDGYQAEWRP